MKKIACVGYHYTGAGAIDDLLRECDNVAQGKSEAEFSLLHIPDGISDLEFHCVENPHRIGTTLAIDRFLIRMKKKRRMFNKIFTEGNWLELTYKYVDAISKFQYKGYTYYNANLKHPIKKYRIVVLEVVNKLIPSKFKLKVNLFPEDTSFHVNIDENAFLAETRKYIDNLCELIPHKHNTEYVVLDQMLAANNPERYIRYVDDVKVVVVDRDPRDVYIQHFLRKDHLYPKEPYQFCQIFRDIRKKIGHLNKNNILFISLEELIYSYDNSIRTVFRFLDIQSEHHVNPRKFFNPEISMKGTKLWKTHPEYAPEIAIIEKELPDYLSKY